MHPDMTVQLCWTLDLKLIEKCVNPTPVLVNLLNTVLERGKFSSELKQVKFILVNKQPTQKK